MAILSGVDTTMKVTTKVRDRLRVLADRHGRTLGEEVAALVEAEEIREMWASFPAALAALPPEIHAARAAVDEWVLRDASERYGAAGWGVGGRDGQGLAGYR